MPPKPFKGQVFALSGKLGLPRKDIEALIEKHGGTVVGSVTTSVTHLISTEDDVKACTAKVATAQGRKIPILQESFLEACVKAKKLLPPGRYTVKVAAAAKKRKAAAKEAPAAAAKVAKKVAAAPVVTNDKLPVIAKSGLEGTAAVVVEEMKKSFGKASITWDVELVLNDPEAGKDKFYNLQLLASKAGDQFWAVKHWGRTGMIGTVRVDGPYDEIMPAKRVFKRTYRQKTGCVWGNLSASFEEMPGKYKLLAKDAKPEPPGLWQYYMHNSVDGKSIGWYEYEGEAAVNMEKYWRQFGSNERLGVRFVQSDYFKYEVNFKAMIQTNTKSGTRRVIRRVAAGEAPSPDAPAEIPEPVKPAAPVPDAESSAEEEEEVDDEAEDEEEDEGHEDEAAAEEAAAEAEAAEEEAEAVGEAAGGCRAAEAAPAGGRAAPEPEEEAAAEAEAAPAGGRAAPADEEPEPPAGGRKAAEAAEDADTDMGEETLTAATLPLEGAARRAP